MKVTHEWKQTYCYKAVADIGKIVKELNKLGDDFGPEDVLNLAENPKTEAHKCFEWNDDICGLKHRKDQARRLVNSIVKKKKKNPDIEIRAYASIEFNDEKKYVPTEIIVKDEDLTKQVISNILSSIKSLINKMKSYEYLNKNIKKSREAIEKAIEKLEVENE